MSKGKTTDWDRTIVFLDRMGIGYTLEENAKRAICEHAGSDLEKCKAIEIGLSARKLAGYSMIWFRFSTTGSFIEVEGRPPGFGGSRVGTRNE